MQAYFRSLSQTLLIAGVLAGMVLAATYPTPAQAQEPPPGSARLAHLQGKVSIQPNGIDSWGETEQNQPVGAGDRIYSDNEGEGELQAAQIRAYFSPLTDLTLTNINEQGVELGIAEGSVNIFSDGFQPGQSLFISTPNGGVTLAGRGNVRIDVYEQQQSTVITVGENSDVVTLNGAGGFAATLGRGQSIQLSGTNPVYSQPLEPAPADAFEHWSSAIESHRFNSISARYVSAEMPGYDELDATGEWQPESDYGPIWFPRVDAGWAPYHYGHWVSRPFYGWVWVADEPWGSAPFHYGRWVQVGNRWGWIPGPRDIRPIWSPAQVVFAGGIQIGGVGVSAWFPLGPGEAYRPWYPASPTYINQINITNIHESRVVHVQNTYVNIVNVTNVTYINRTSVVAVKQEDFAAGRSVNTVVVKVAPQQMEHIQPARPEAKPPAQPIILHPVAKPTAVPAARPVLINHQGQAAPAAPNAKPMVVPVKAAPPAPKPIPGRAAIGTPSVGGKPAAMAPAAPKMEPAKPEPMKPVVPTPAEKPVAPKVAPPAPKPVPPTPERPTPPAVKPPAPSQRPVAPDVKPPVKPVPPAKDAKKPQDKKPEDKKPE
jgi:hypothetical protein